jgi:transposase
MTKTLVSPELRIENLDHLGIVAGICDRIGLVERVDERLGVSPDELVSSGQVLKAMILNGLGFLSAPMYLFSRFFEGKPTEHLLGKGVKPEHLNDDKLARVLDKLYEAGLTSLFVEVALQAANQEGIKIDRLHLDATSFGVHGRYLSEQEKKEEKEEEEPEPIHITYGYSRDGRPDLKQFLVDLMVSSEGGVPVFFRAADGNESEAAVFSELIMDYRRHVDLDALFVADAALYNEENLKLMGKLKFVSRVPQTIKRAKDLLEAPDKEEGEEEGLAFSEAKNREGYHVAEVQAEYAALKQRWIVVHSEKRARGDLKRLEKRVEKHLEREHEEALKALKALGKRFFGCERDAREAANKLEKGLRYYRLKETMTIKASPYHAKPGRPRQDAPPPIIATASRSKTSAQRIFWHARRRRSLKTSARRDASSWPPACSTPRHCPRRRSWRRTWTNRWSKEASDS